MFQSILQFFSFIQPFAFWFAILCVLLQFSWMLLLRIDKKKKPKRPGLDFSDAGDFSRKRK